MTWVIIGSCFNLASACAFVLFMHFQRKAQDELFKLARANDTLREGVLGSLREQINHQGFAIAALQTTIHFKESCGRGPSDSGA